jgi:hypothetical protein
MEPKKLVNMTEPELRELLQMMGYMITRCAKEVNVEKPHFVLLLFNDPQVSQYVSNCTRESTIQALREAADRLEKQEDVTR